MRVIKILLIVLLSINLCTAQNKPVKVTDAPYYQTAYTEITDMLEGRIPTDFKRAVFLPEWAYLWQSRWKIHAEFKKNRDILKGLGYTNMDEKLYQQLMDNMVEQQKKEQAKKLAGN